MNESNDEPIEDDDSFLPLCRPIGVPYAPNKAGRRVLGDFVDRIRRQNGTETARVQDADRRHVGDSRFDINSYAGGPTTIRDVGVIEKRKVR